VSYYKPLILFGRTLPQHGVVHVTSRLGLKQNHNNLLQ